MSRITCRFALLLALGLALAPGLAEARAGFGSSMGSRGSMTYSAPPPTATAPRGGSYMQRSLTPNSGSSTYGSPSYSPGGYGGRGFGFGGGFTSGLLGGLIGAGLGGLLFGHGFFGGMSGLGGFFGLLLQMFLLVLLVRWLFRRFAGGGSPVFAGPGLFGRTAQPGAANPMGSQARPSGRAITIEPADYQSFERGLQNIQGAWSAHDLNALQSMATPEMVSYFGEQLSQQVSRGVRNLVSDVRLDRGDLAEAWSEGGRDYATVAMRFSMVDVTYDQGGRVVDGSPAERVMATELWTFLRSPGGRWILSAIQQAT